MTYRHSSFSDPYSIPREDGPPTLAVRFAHYVLELAGIAVGLAGVVALVVVVVMR